MCSFLFHEIAIVTVYRGHVYVRAWIQIQLGIYLHLPSIILWGSKYIDTYSISPEPIVEPFRGGTEYMSDNACELSQKKKQVTKWILQKEWVVQLMTIVRVALSQQNGRPV